MLKFCVVVVWVLTLTISTQQVPDREKMGLHWKQAGQKHLKAAMALEKVETVAKNVILFLGDGMGLPTVTATRIYKGQKNGKGGVEEDLAFDQFPFVSLSKTYGVDRQTSDSANTGTAYLCGVKANYGTIGVDGRVRYENCSSSLDPTTHVYSILKWAQDAGKSTGFVTTTSVTDASPAGLYAHSPSRYWQASAPYPCMDIARQLIEDVPGKNIRVIMGGGIKNFIPETKVDVHGEKGDRKDSRNLLNDWRRDKKSRNAKGRIVFDAEDLRKINIKNVDFLMGLFDSDYMPYVSDIPELKRDYPSLSEMTETAMKILSKNPKGYFLMVEGGNIDMAHHDNLGQKALEEGYEFDKAIDYAVKNTDMKDTLIVVTADHSHTFSISGNYPLRGTNILGIGGVSDVDNKTFTTIGYYNGPGYKSDERSHNLTQEEVLNKDYHQGAVVPMLYSTHGAEDVAVYARGPMAHLYHGVHDQTYIPYVMGYASCVGPNREHCEKQ